MADKEKKEKYISTAKVIDGVLILSLPDALTPVVWQMELGQSKSSALEIRDAGDNHFVLTLKTPRQDVLEIATYNDRDLAIKALLVVSQAMEQAQGQLKAAATTGTYLVPTAQKQSNDNRGFPVKRILMLGLKSAGAIILLGLAYIMISAFIHVATNSSTSGSAAGSGNAPVSADDFLENR